MKKTMAMASKKKSTFMNKAEKHVIGGKQKYPGHAKFAYNQEQNIQDTETYNDDDELLNDPNFIQNRPAGQPIYTEAQLNEDLPPKMLTPNNPQAPQNITTYSFKERKFITDELVDQLALHFVLDGDQILKESPEAKINQDIKDLRSDQIKEAKKQQELEQQDDDNQQINEKELKKAMRNKFNYNERQAQTLNNQIRTKTVSTKPPPSENYSSQITQWQIFDAYIDDFKEKENKGKDIDMGDIKQEKSLYSVSFKRCLKIMERMVVQNDNQEKYYDYKYFWSEDEPTLDSTKNEGCMLPIWRFSSEKQRRKNVTSICWNPRYPDLFAIGLGSYDFASQKLGLICLYSLKNTTHPEYSFTTEAGVMTLDFHPKSAALLAVGLYDGTVLVFDVRNKHKKPIYQSTVRTQKHTDPVWQVIWNADTSKKYNFYSVSSDGRIMNWILMKNKLEPEEVIKLKLKGKNSDEETSLIGLAGGLCFDFNQFDNQIFIVGTEEGWIHKCSRSYSGQYQENYKAHLLAVYKVKWNNFHERTFISASHDWTVKIWDCKISTPIMSFDLGTPVVDAVWAPYSSTVFATATLEKVCVYDLNIDKHGKIAEQKPVKQNQKLTNLAFNKRDPIILVGDTHGGVVLLKLSPNLTRGLGNKIPPKEADAGMTHMEYERKKMEDLLSVVGKFERDEQ